MTGSPATAEATGAPRRHFPLRWYLALFALDLLFTLSPAIIGVAISTLGSVIGCWRTDTGCQLFGANWGSDPLSVPLFAIWLAVFTVPIGIVLGVILAVTLGIHAVIHRQPVT